MVDATAFNLLRRGVVDGAQPLSCVGQAVAVGDHFGQAEVAYVQVLGAWAALEQDVARFDVAMHDAAPMRGVQRRSGLLHDGRRPVWRDGSLVAEQPSQIDAVDVAHDQQRLAVLLRDRVDRDDVRML